MIEVQARTATGDVGYRLRSLSESRAGGVYQWTVRWPGWEMTDPLALDLLEISKAVFLADRAVRRSLNFGQRTREFHLRIPVRRVAVWRRAKALLESLARFASTDVWKLEFRPAESRRQSRQQRKRAESTATVVALFSGGLDSLCGAAYLARAGQNPIFVSHSPPGRETCSSLVERTFAAFERGELRDDQCVTFRLEVRERERDGRRSMFQEPTRRTRPFFFLSLACSVALDTRVTTVQMSENGAFALSLPIRADAYGALCSRQAHAFLLHGFKELLNLVSPCAAGWMVYNPFEQMTKGEACQLLDRASYLACEAVSCEYVGRQAASLWAWKKKHPVLAGGVGKGPQCGVCLPCLVRRAALHKAHIPDPADAYFFDARKVHKWDVLSRSPSQRDAGRHPPLYYVAAPHVYHVRHFCERLRSMTPHQFAMQYLPELRLPQTPDSHSDEALRQRYHLVLCFANELQEFLDS